MREDSNTTPPAPVARMLADLGYVSVDLPNRAPWWQAPNGKAGPWEEAIDAASAEIIHLRQVAALAPKKFYRTSEFWTALVSLLGLLGAGASTLAGELDAVPEQYREMVGAALMGFAAAIPPLYRMARTTEKSIKAIEQAKALADGPKVGG